jgi:hypothetical protein
LLKNYLEYTETKQLPEADEAGDPAETLDVGGVVAGLRAALESRGLTVMENVGTSNVRVDLAVQENDGFVLGIMVDGPRYAALPSVCDRERLLPSVLEGLRWKLSRVWAMQWHRHPDRVVERLLEELEVARSDAANEQAAADAAAEAAAIAEAAENDAIRLKDASPGESAPVLPYQQLAVTLKGTSAEFTALDANAIRGVLEAVVRAEGPIPVSEAQRRTLAHWDMSRSGKRARSKVDEAATLAADAGALRLEGRFLWPTDLEAAHVRDRSKQGPRDVSLIADEEISAALRIVAHKEIRVASLDLIKRAAKLMGFPRAGKKIQAGMRAVLEALIASGELTEENAVITVPDAG